MISRSPDLEEITEQSKLQRKERDEEQVVTRAKCFVCERFSKVEFDHPVPKASGGELLVPLCLSCHEDLDRTALDQWDPQEALVALMSLWHRSGQNERLVILKMARVVAHVQAVNEEQDRLVRELIKSKPDQVVEAQEGAA